MCVGANDFNKILTWQLWLIVAQKQFTFYLTYFYQFKSTTGSNQSQIRMVNNNKYWTCHICPIATVATAMRAQCTLHYKTETNKQSRELQLWLYLSIVVACVAVGKLFGAYCYDTLNSHAGWKTLAGHMEMRLVRFVYNKKIFIIFRFS